MNYREKLRKAVEWSKLGEVPLLSGVYIIQQRRLHDSGYRLMTIVGHTKDFQYYILDECADVVDFESYFSKIPIDSLHVDINRHGVIHIWSNVDKFKCVHAVSSCSFETR